MLKHLGALPLGAGVYALPRRPALERELRTLCSKVLEGGGDAFLLRAVPLTAEDGERMALRAEAHRGEEYAQVAKSARHFIEHVEREEATHDYRFAEVESLEEELEKVRRQFDRVVQRDFFRTEARRLAEGAVSEATARFDRYVHTAYAHDPDNGSELGKEFPEP
jgi:hypothetical protein